MERPTTTTTTTSTGSPHQISVSSTAATPPPTIFVQAEPHTFRDLVQKHTGAPAGDAPDKLPVTSPPPSARSFVGPRRPAFKLQDRRPSVRKLEIKLGLASLDHHHQQRQHGAYPSPRSPQPPSTPGQQYLLIARAGAPIPKASLTSPVTPLGSGPVFSPPGVSEEERAIAEKGFYLHPSPRGTPPGVAPPELLTLFPLTSPRLPTSQSGGGDDAADGRIEKERAHPR